MRVQLSDPGRYPPLARRQQHTRLVLKRLFLVSWGYPSCLQVLSGGHGTMPQHY
jgi:hypothetical protein